MRGVRAVVGEDSGVIPWSISAFGGLFLLAFLAEAAYFSGLDTSILLSDGPIVAFLLVVPFVGGLVYGGYWLERSDVGAERYPRVVWWTLGGAGALLALNAILLAVWPPDSAWVGVGWLRGTANMGAAVGLLVGLIEARAVEHALAAERSRLRAEQLERRREWLDYLNGLLRHEVLNTAQVINGYAEAVLDDDDLPEETRTRLAAIQRQSEDMTDIIGDVRVLLDATRGDVGFERVDLATVLRDEVRDLRDAYGAVEVEVDVPESVLVRADALLPRVFANLLANAVEHNDSELPRVTVVAEAGDATAVVRIGDNGPGIPAGDREGLFERGASIRSDHGLGLYLVRQLVERYDGSVDLVETGEAGTTFRVELPLAPSEPTPQASPAAVPSGTGSTSGDPGLDGKRVIVPPVERDGN